MRYLLVLLFISSACQASPVKLGDEDRSAFCTDAGGVAQPYDPANPPMVAPNIETCFITISWPGNTPFNIPAKWPVSDIDNTVQSEMTRFNAPLNVNNQISQGLGG